MTAPQPVLVTGAFGKVGGSVVRQLIDDGHRVAATDLGRPSRENPQSRLLVILGRGHRDTTNQLTARLSFGFILAMLIKMVILTKITG
jgi:nucleoside-diphosphate-sugar epimerase